MTDREFRPVPDVNDPTPERPFGYVQAEDEGDDPDMLDDAEQTDETSADPGEPEEEEEE